MNIFLVILIIILLYLLYNSSSIEAYSDLNNIGSYQLELVNPDATYSLVAFSQFSLETQNDIISRLNTIGYGVLANAFGDQTNLLTYAAKKATKIIPNNDIVFAVLSESLKDSELIDNQSSIAFNSNDNPVYMTNQLGTKYTFSRQFNTQLLQLHVDQFSTLMMISPTVENSEIAEIKDDTISELNVSILPVNVVHDRKIFILTLTKSASDIKIIRKPITTLNPIPSEAPVSAVPAESAPIPSPPTPSVNTETNNFLQDSVPTPHSPQHSVYTPAPVSMPVIPAMPEIPNIAQMTSDLTIPNIPVPQISIPPIHIPVTVPDSVAQQISDQPQQISDLPQQISDLPQQISDQPK